VAHIAENRNAYGLLVGKLETDKHFENLGINKMIKNVTERDNLRDRGQDSSG
jgi:tetrahydromethanopterin S-methyltransferase subunit A